MEEIKQHARYSPSGASKWIRCPGSIALESICPDKPSKYAVEGTAAHMLAEKTLTDGNFYARAYLGEIFEIKENDNGKQVIFPIEVTDEMCEFIQEYVDKIRDRVEEYKMLGDVSDVHLFVEEKIDLSGVIGIPDQFGTADIVIVVEYKDGTSLISVEDLKYGLGVTVDAQDNEQLLTYAAGAMDMYSSVFNITKVNVVVHQVRKEHISEAIYTADEVLEFGAKLKAAASRAEGNYETFKANRNAEDLELSPGDKQCRFCKAAGHCPALSERAISSILEEMDDLDEKPLEVAIKEKIENIDLGLIDLAKLGKFMDATSVVEEWLRVVRGRVEAELFLGNEVPGYKLVEGRRGSRIWANMTRAEEVMKAMRLKQDEMYTKKIISPPQAEKLLAKERKRLWKKLQEEITQNEGKPSVAPISDRRMALVISPTADECETFGDEDLV